MIISLHLSFSFVQIPFKYTRYRISSPYICRKMLMYLAFLPVPSPLAVHTYPIPPVSALRAHFNALQSSIVLNTSFEASLPYFQIAIYCLSVQKVLHILHNFNSGLMLFSHHSMFWKLCSKVADGVMRKNAANVTSVPSLVFAIPKFPIPIIYISSRIWFILNKNVVVLSYIYFRQIVYWPFMN